MNQGPKKNWIQEIYDVIRLKTKMKFKAKAIPVTLYPRTSKDFGGIVEVPKTIISKKKDIKCLGDKNLCGPWASYIIGFFLLLGGITSIIYSPFQICLKLRLQMTPGLPPYDWWANPPDEVLFRVYIFNITNSEQFLSGDEPKLRFQEIGPIVYREKLIHTNVTFNKNGTLTYTATRIPIYLPDMNTIDLNSSLVVPNLAVLGMASYLSEAPFFAKFGFNLLMRRLDSQPIINISIYDYLFNCSDPLMMLSETFVPSMVPTHNLGVLHEVYRNFKDVVTVYVGSKHGDDKFFLIDQYDGSPDLPGYDKKCTKSLQNSTEGVSYPQYLTKKSTVRYWRKTLCRDVELFYEKEVNWRGIKAYRYKLPNNTYDRTEPLSKDCFQGIPTLPNGFIDVSPCYYDLPIVASFPHFMHANPKAKNYIEGLEPNETKHQSFVLIEPMTGIPLNSRARSQSSLLVRDLSGFSNKLQPFSDKILPMFYLEYNQVGLPWYIYSLLYFIVNILPIVEKVFSGFCIVLGFLLIAVFIRRKRRHRRLLLDSQELTFERESFLKP